MARKVMLALDDETEDMLERLATDRGTTFEQVLAELVHQLAQTQRSATTRKSSSQEHNMGVMRNGGSLSPQNKPDVDAGAYEEWPDWMDVDAIDAVQAGLTTVERLRIQREAWLRQAATPLTPEQEEERAAWAAIREAAAATLLNRDE